MSGAARPQRRWPGAYRGCAEPSPAASEPPLSNTLEAKGRAGLARIVQRSAAASNSYPNSLPHCAATEHFGGASPSVRLARKKFVVELARDGSLARWDPDRA